MANVNYVKEGTQVDATKDSVIVRKHIAGLAGGRALDLTGYTAKEIPCGLPIITDGNGTYKPLAPADTTVESVTTYGFTLPDGYSYAGICGASVLAGKGVSVVTAAVINETAMVANITEKFPSSMTTPNALSLSAIKSALPHIIWESDEAYDAPSNN